ncbi:hypothetical protein E2C01_032398 [Portunus trituberculatus]|uniref:Uncharacterized protein n=1 Tax=Portunus trituberculatus TaxID=210409 RepID=A0A5B7EXE5_PORTR|nr:hypothetical protein [Portunus trituberculatus]
MDTYKQINGLIQSRSNKLWTHKLRLQCRCLAALCWQLQVRQWSSTGDAHKGQGSEAAVPGDVASAKCRREEASFWEVTHSAQPNRGVW